MISIWLALVLLHSLVIYVLWRMTGVWHPFKPQLRRLCMIACLLALIAFDQFLETSQFLAKLVLYFALSGAQQ